MTEHSPWTMQRQAASHLGVSESTLQRWRRSGLLQAGRHFRRKFVSENSPLLYHLDRCDEAMTQAFARPAEQVERASDRSRYRHSRH